MLFTLTNRGQVEKTFQVSGSYKRITLLPGKSVTIEGKEKDYEYYRGRGLKVVTQSSAMPPKTVVKEEVKEEVKEDFFGNEKKVDDEDLSADAIYSFDFLTKKKAIAVLEARGINFEDDLNATELKNLVIESNPS